MGLTQFPDVKFEPCGLITNEEYNNMTKYEKKIYKHQSTLFGRDQLIPIIRRYQELIKNEDVSSEGNLRQMQDEAIKNRDISIDSIGTMVDID